MGGWVGPLRPGGVGDMEATPLPLPLPPELLVMVLILSLLPVLLWPLPVPNAPVPADGDDDTEATPLLPLLPGLLMWLPPAALPLALVLPLSMLDALSPDDADADFQLICILLARDTQNSFWDTMGYTGEKVGIQWNTWMTMYCSMHNVVLAGTRWLKEVSAWLKKSRDLHSWSAAKHNKAGTKFITQAFSPKENLYTGIGIDWDTQGKIFGIHNIHEKTFGTHTA